MADQNSTTPTREISEELQGTLDEIVEKYKTLSDRDKFVVNNIIKLVTSGDVKTYEEYEKFSSAFEAYVLRYYDENIAGKTTILTSEGA